VLVGSFLSFLFVVLVISRFSLSLSLSLALLFTSRFETCHETEGATRNARAEFQKHKASRA